MWEQGVFSWSEGGEERWANGMGDKLRLGWALFWGRGKAGLDIHDMGSKLGGMEIGLFREPVLDEEKMQMWEMSIWIRMGFCFLWMQIGRGGF